MNIVDNKIPTTLILQCVGRENYGKYSIENRTQQFCNSEEKPKCNVTSLQKKKILPEFRCNSEYKHH